MIDTDVQRNFAHIRPYLGVMLVGSVALMFGLLMYNAMGELTQTIHTTNPDGMEGSIELKYPW